MQYNDNEASQARAEIFRITRILENYTQDEFAEKLKLGSSSTCSRVERLNARVSLKYVEKYINAFGIKMIDYLEAEKEVVKILSEKKKLRNVAFVVCKLLEKTE